MGKLDRASSARVHLRQIATENQCTEDWSKMRGEGATRHCASCKNDVFNLSEMTEAEAEAVLALPGNTCVRYYHRPDGTIVATRPAPVANVSAPAHRSRAKMAVVVAAAMAYPVAFVGIRAAVDGANSEARAEAESDSSIRLAMGGIKIRKPVKPSPNPSKILVIGNEDATEYLREQLVDAKHDVTFSKTRKGTSLRKYDVVITGEEVNPKPRRRYGKAALVRSNGTIHSTIQAVEDVLSERASKRSRKKSGTKNK